MLDVLRRREVTDILATVTRYFGGVLLGAPGLIRAYSGGVAAAMDEAPLLTKVSREVVRLTVPAADAGRVDHAVRGFVGSEPGAHLDAVTYGAEAHFDLAVSPTARQALDTLIASGAIRAGVSSLGTRLVTMAG
jgi:putative IMPACT (imprinted ancient) family translation regulator